MYKPEGFKEMGNYILGQARGQIIAWFRRNEATPPRPENKDEDDKKAKALTKRMENDQLFQCNASAPKRKNTGVDTLRECLNTTKGKYAEFDKMLKEFINSKSMTPVDDYHRYRSQKTLDMRKPFVERSLSDSFLYTPPELIEEKKLTIDRKDRHVHIVVDPSLVNILKPYQRDGVKLMDKYVIGSKVENNYGCILSDEVKLGKTLQCITLMWTLLRQNPLGKATFDKAIIVCPSNLVEQ
uniref:SNF2_N domain-containing protein n=1 Tax=Strongyloides venezuelensis TaxID=75913 RepID=A0A0K0FUP0_STRVS